MEGAQNGRRWTTVSAQVVSCRVYNIECYCFSTSISMITINICLTIGPIQLINSFYKRAQSQNGLAINRYLLPVHRAR